MKNRKIPTPFDQVVQTLKQLVEHAETQNRRGFPVESISAHPQLLQRSDIPALEEKEKPVSVIPNEDAVGTVSLQISPKLKEQTHVR